MSEKLLDKRGRNEGVSRQSIKLFLSHSTEKLRRGTFLVLTKFLVSKIFIDKRWEMKEGGVSRFSVKNVFSDSTEKLRNGTFLCSTNCLVSKKFMVKG